MGINQFGLNPLPAMPHGALTQHSHENICKHKAVTCAWKNEGQGIEFVNFKTKKHALFALAQLNTF